MANEKLKKKKADIRTVEEFARSKPLKGQIELAEFLTDKGIEELNDYASKVLELETQKRFILYNCKLNTSRL